MTATPARATPSPFAHLASAAKPDDAAAIAAAAAAAAATAIPANPAAAAESGDAGAASTITFLEPTAGKKAKKTKKKDGEEDEGETSDDDGGDETDEEDEDEPEARAVAKRQRGRIAAILNSEPGKALRESAILLATGTSMPRTQAIAMLASFQAAAPAAAAKPAQTEQRDQLRDRMASVEQPNIGVGDAASGPNLAQQIVLAGKKRRGEV